MAVLDIVVLLLVGGFGVRGLIKGFVNEVLSLCAVVAGIVAVRFLHAPIADWFAPYLGNEYIAALIVFVTIFGLIYVGVKLIAGTISSGIRNVGLGMVDRVLGLGFGAIKGILIATLCFVGFTFVYDALYGELSPRPEWLRVTRSFPLLNASGEAMSSWVAENSRDGGLAGLAGGGAETDGSGAAKTKDKAEP